MKKLRKLIRIPELYLGMLLVVFGLLAASDNVVGKNITITKGGETRQTAFPIMEKMAKGENFLVAFDVRAADGDYDLHIIPDDCVRQIVVNGVEVPLGGIDGLCNYSNGFFLRHERFDGTGRDHFELDLRNTGGPGGLNVEISHPLVSSNSAYSVIFWVVFCGLCFCILRRLRIPAVPLVILICGIALRIAFTESLPSPSKFGHDVDGHVAYVQYIVEKGSIPDADDCWTCYHPPVYFASVSPAWRFAGLLNMTGDEALQMISLFFSFIILIMGFFVLQKWLCGTPLNIATLLWTFWPVMIISCSRIGNDQLFYVFHIVCLWGSVKYVKERDGRSLLVAAVASLLAIWTKSTGAISVGVCMLALRFGYFGPVGWLRLKKTELAAIAVMVLTVGGYLVHTLMSDGGLVGNANSLNHGLTVGKNIVNFLYIDWQQMIGHPFTNAWDDELGRQYFLSYLMKTSLFGEFVLFKQGAGVTFAQATNVSFFVLLAYAIRGFWVKKVSRTSLLFTAQIVAFVLAVAFLRFKYPYSCSNDFRFIEPVLLSVIPFMTMGISAPGSSTKSRVLGITAAVVFAVSSVVTMFFVMGSF